MKCNKIPCFQQNWKYFPKEAIKKIIVDYLYDSGLVTEL